MASFAFTKRTLVVVVAVGLAGAASLGLVAYVGGIEEEALRSTEAVQTFVAKDIIPVGTVGGVAISKGMIGRRPVPRAGLTEGGIRSLAEIKDKVAGVTILRGEQIMGARFVSSSEARGMRPIASDRQAVSVEVALPPGVAGFLKPGDRLSVIAHVDAAGSGGGEARVQYLLQDIEVLAVGNRTANTETKGSGGALSGSSQQQQRVLLTLALTPIEAEKMVYAILKGQLYFSLLPPDQKPVLTPGRTATNVFN